MKSSKGGVSAGFILDMHTDDFLEAIDAAAEVEQEIAAAIRG